MSAALPTSFLYRNGPLSAFTPSSESWRASSMEAATPATATEREAPISVLPVATWRLKSEEHTSELQSHVNLVCRLLLEKKKTNMDCIPTSKKKRTNRDTVK